MVEKHSKPRRLDPSVSLIIICFNNSPFIGAAVESALAQTRAADEIIVVDNGSSDGSSEVLSRYARDGRIRIESLNRNFGPGIARNRGIACASGDYVLFLDGDDLLEPDAVAEALKAATAQGADLVQFGYRRCGETDEAAGGTDTGTNPVSGDAARRAMLQASPAVWTRLYRRDLLLRVNEPFEPGIYEDIAWSARHILEATSPLIISAHLVRHRVYRNSTIKARHAGHLDFAAAIAHLVRVMRISLPKGWKKSEIGTNVIFRIRKFAPNVLLRTGVRGWLAVARRLNEVMSGLDEEELEGVSALLSGRAGPRSTFGRRIFWMGNASSAAWRGSVKLVGAARDSHRLPGRRGDILGQFES